MPYQVNRDQSPNKWLVSQQSVCVFGFFREKVLERLIKSNMLCIILELSTLLCCKQA